MVWPPPLGHSRGPTPSHPSLGQSLRREGQGPASMKGHIGPLFPRKSELWRQGRVPGRGEPSGAACSCWEVREHNQEPGGRSRGRGGGSWPVLQNAFPGLSSEDRVEGVIAKITKKVGAVSIPSLMEEGMKQHRKMAFLGLSQQCGCPGSRPVPPLWPLQGTLPPL